MPVTSVSPADGGTFLVVPDGGGGIAFQFTSPVVGMTSVYIEVASQSSPLGQDGTLADDFVQDFFAAYQSDAYPGTYRGASNHVGGGHWWTSRPGTYYWQARGSYTDYSSGFPTYRTFISPVYSITLVLPACRDTVDNDDDGSVDSRDWGCTSVDDLSEVLDFTPGLGVAEAKRLIRQVLRERFRRNYRAGYGKRIWGCGRASSVRVRCRTSWVVGDLSWTGRVTIWNSREGEEVFWNHAYVIKRTDEYCKAVRKRRNCSKVYRVG